MNKNHENKLMEVLKDLINNPKYFDKDDILLPYYNIYGKKVAIKQPWMITNEK